MNYTRKINSRSRSLKLSLTAHGEVVVSTPRFVPEFAVKQFVNSHKDWIETHLAELNEKRNKLLKEKSNSILFFGEEFILVKEIDHKKKIGVHINDESKSLLVNPVSDSAQSMNRALNRFLESTLHSYVLERVEYFSKKMETVVLKIAFKRQSSRWGSCSSIGNLNFNWQLVHAPKKVIDYVIVHELAHRTHMDHSTAFWKLVEQFDSEFRIHRGWLKRHGMILQSQTIVE